jgi:hypothetical protein
MEAKVTTSEFEQRVASLSLGGFGPGLPRKRRDRQILLKSVAVRLGHGRSYSEADINDALQSWLDGMGPGARMDHVSLRRYLIDERYVTRDAGGATYEICQSESLRSVFEPEVDSVDSFRVVSDARADQDRRRRDRAA